jgi:hypothetical protein
VGIALAGLTAGIVALLALVVPTSPPPPATTAADARAAYGKLPLSFIPNRGQNDARVRYYAQAPGFGFYLTDDKAVLSLAKGKRGTALEMRFVGANPDSRLVAGGPMPGKVNYLTGSQHHTNLSTYREVTYRDLWPGIDMVFRGAGGQLKYEFHVAAGADPSRIRLAYAGAGGLTVGAEGHLAIATPLGTLRDARPVSYQRVGGERVPVGSRYTLHGATGYGFALGSHDAARRLVIDPGLEYSTYIASPALEEPTAIALGPNRAAYLAGTVYGSGFPATPGAFDVTSNHPSAPDIYVAQLDPAGSELVYATYLGGTRFDYATGLDVDASGKAYVSGYTNSTDFPITAGVVDTQFEGTVEAVVTKLNPSGSALEYSTYLGGNYEDYAYGIAVDAAGSAHLTGRTTSSDFPTTNGAYDRVNHDYEDAFVTKLNPNGSAFAYSTYLGGNNYDHSEAIALDGGGGVYVAGYTHSADFPTTAGAFDSSHDLSADVFITRMNPAGTALLASTYLGRTAFDRPTDVAVGQDGSPYVAAMEGSNDFVAKLDPGLSAVFYSNYPVVATIEAVAVDAAGSAHLTGNAGSNFSPTSDGFDTTPNGSSDAYVMKLDPAGSTVSYATFLGGSASDKGADIALDTVGGIYVTGETSSTDYPTTPGAYAPSTPYAHSNEIFVTKLNPPEGFPRPKTARAVEVSLVPDYIRCDEPSSNHGPPLAYPSCDPPLLGSGELTLGTPDSNGLPARGTGLARYLAVPGNPATPADEADVQISFALHDVHNRFVFTEYTGEVRLVSPLRITDKFEIPGTTMTDVPLATNVSCAGTVDPGTGSSCALVTTVEALLPGAVTEGKRSVWELGQVRVEDAGPDDDVDTTADNTLLMTQGVFVP